MADTAAMRKARGAFFTPPDLCGYIARWAIRSGTDRVMEPSCGEAAFLIAAGQELVGLDSRIAADQLLGIELHAESAAAARQRLAVAGIAGSIGVGDFFDMPAERRFDAVIGNPPYVRYQDFTGVARTQGRRAALGAGVGLTALASSWAAFTVHAAEFLRPGGRLGLVLPAELLTVNYAADVRRYLMERFGRVRLVLFTERVFPGVLEEVVLLLAENALALGGTDHCELYQVSTAADLAAELTTGQQTSGRAPHTWRPVNSRAKWTPALLPTPALNAYTALAAGPGFTVLQSWGKTTLGMVTGRNNYFALSPSRVRQLRLREDEVLPLSPPGSRHLRGLSLTSASWKALGDSGAATMLFYPGRAGEPLSAGARRYVREGEATGINQAYKCRVRTPWWQVPLIPPADLLLTYMNADTPRLTTNAAAVPHLNSVHGVYLDPELRSLGRELLPLASLNSMTLLGAELVGRAYGGGMLKLEPREADLLPVPSPTVLREARTALQARRGGVRAALRRGDLAAAVRLIDEVLLLGMTGLDSAQHTALITAHAMLSARRTARGATRLPVVR